MKNLRARAEKIEEKLKKWRRHLHANPELSFQEKQTSLFIVNELKRLGITTIKTGVGGHGLVATLKGGEGPIIGVRADMDALPIEEKTEVGYASKNKGVMHACGHDAHSAILLGVAKLLKEDINANRLRGTVKLIFQPAEEDTDEKGFTGAPYVLKSGAITDLEKAIALHMCPWHYTGDIQVNEGPSMANIDNFKLKVIGTGGHGGYPHEGTDPIWMASFVLQGIYGLISRKVNPLEVGTISVGKIRGGEAENVIPGEVEISGTIRSYTKEVRELLLAELKKVASIVDGLGGKYELFISKGEPALNNDKELIKLIKASANQLYPHMNIIEEPYGMGGEDFSHIAEKIPSAMFFLGCRKRGDIERKLHTPIFDIDESALPVGVALLTYCVHQLLVFGGDL